MKGFAWRVALLAVATLGIQGCGGCDSTSRTPPRHVLLLVIDTQRADHLSCYGYPRPTSPAIDALAGESALFRNAVSQASWTLPSMVSMMTASYVGDEVLSIPDGKTTLAEAFRERGFATGAFICNDLLSPENRFERGFDTFEWKLVPYGSNQPILDWIRAHKDAPTFTFVHLNEVHDDVKRPDGSNYGPEPVSERGRFRKEKGALSPERLRYYDSVSERLHLLDKAPSLAKIEAEIGGYDDDVAFSDKRIGEILDEYRKLGLWDATAVVLGSDHGEGLWTREQFLDGTRKSAMDRGEPATLVNTLQMTHGSQAAIELLRVPLLLKAPGLASTRVDAWVENVDIAPTLLELCGIPVPNSAQGKSLLALAGGSKRGKAAEDAVFSYTRFQWSMITQEGLQLLHPTPRGECSFDLAEELYDLPRDPEARVNLFAGRREATLAVAKVGTERVKSGIHGGTAVASAQLQKSLAGLGYIDSGVVDLVREELASKPTEELVRELGDSHDCLMRLEILRVLRDRTLSPEQVAALRAIAEREVSAALREGIRVLLPR